MNDNLRPCTVNGKKALFHDWTTNDQLFMKFDALLTSQQKYQMQCEFNTNHTVPYCASTEKISNSVGIVEFEDGSVRLIEPQAITFVDSTIIMKQLFKNLSNFKF